MIHTLQLKSEELLTPEYFHLRNTIDPEADIIHLAVTHSHLQNVSTEDIYKSILKLDGKYRTAFSKWTAPPVKVRVINQL